eukprot:INCI4988.2.p3 GENE.INCI4988.2~~INCI4988.2.p3  ORF type:complete len:133 (+),score=4.36 INCI4988.2:161-559(+)
MYYAAHGNFYLVRYFPPAGSGAYRNWTQYSNSYPYFPYKDKVDCFSTSRSEVPNVGYTQMVVEGDTIPDPLDPGNLLLMGLYNWKGLMNNQPAATHSTHSPSMVTTHSPTWQQKARIGSCLTTPTTSDSVRC